MSDKNDRPRGHDWYPVAGTAPLNPCPACAEKDARIANLRDSLERLSAASEKVDAAWRDFFRAVGVELTPWQELLFQLLLAQQRDVPLGDAPDNIRRYVKSVHPSDLPAFEAALARACVPKVEPDDILLHRRLSQGLEQPAPSAWLGVPDWVPVFERERQEIVRESERTAEQPPVLVLHGVTLESVSFVGTDKETGEPIFNSLIRFDPTTVAFEREQQGIASDPPPAPETIRCPHCQNETAADRLTCWICAKPLRGEGASGDV